MHAKLHILAKFERPQLNTTFQILLSASVLSLVFPYFTWLTTSFNSLHLFTFISSLFNYYINRQVMFLICNCILIFVTNYSGSVHDEVSMKVKDCHHSLEPEFGETKVCAGDEELNMEDKKWPLEEVEEPCIAQRFFTLGVKRRTIDREPCIAQRLSNPDIEGRTSVRVLLPNKEDKGEGELRLAQRLPTSGVKGRSSVGVLLTDKADEGEGNYNQNVDDCENGPIEIIEETDERFEDFIKKMKEKMRIEALRTSIMV